MGLLVRRQAGGGRYQGSIRHLDGEEGQRARRRRDLGPHGQHRLLEHGDGRGPLPDAALERVRFVLIVTADMAIVDQTAGVFTAPATTEPAVEYPGERASWLQVAPLVLVLLMFFGLPMLVVLAVSFFDFS